ncbi:PadR family transcriptional regulator [Granulicoccus sp. GXG6511]|uniref:PadR family transcriptional regulator n=1 Tax=Granulicoccus sp. GXG6511 TaxID=3381351 RepID=UPI003D7EF565
MKAIAEGNQLVLPFLGMLLEQPRTSRELLGHLGPGSRFEHISPHSGTIYSLMLTLVDAGWITYVNKAPNHLDRICAITPAGREELKRRLGEALVNTSWTSGHQFVTALPYLHLFERDVAVALLDQRATSLRARSLEFMAAATSKQRSLPEVAKDDYLDSRTQFEITWIEDYRDQVAAMPWPPVESVAPAMVP